MKRNGSLISINIILFCVLLTLSSNSTAQPREELRIAVSAWGNETLIPSSEFGKAMDYMKLLYDPIFGSSPDGRPSPNNGIAERWETSPDALIWTIYIRKGVKFHNGVEVTAKDVRFSMEEAIKPTSKLAYAGPGREIIKAIELKDPYTLIVHCKKPSLFMSELFSDTGSTGCLIIPKDYFEKVGQDRFSKNPVGSGPYKLNTHVTGSHIKLESAGKH